MIKGFYLFLYTGESNSHAKPKQQAFSQINSFFNGRFLRENFSLQKSSNSSCLYSSVTELRTEHALRCSWKSCMCTRNLVSCMLRDNQLARVFQTLDSATQQINHQPADNYQGNQLHFSVDRHLSSGLCYPAFEQLGPNLQVELISKINCRL